MYLTVLSTELATLNARYVYKSVISVSGDHGRMGARSRLALVHVFTDQ